MQISISHLTSFSPPPLIVYEKIDYSKNIHQEKLVKSLGFISLGSAHVKSKLVIACQQTASVMISRHIQYYSSGP